MRWPFAVQKGLTLGLPETSPSWSTRFAFRLFRQFGTEKNPVTSFSLPPACCSACACCRRAQAGETREEMEKVLEVAGLEPEELQIGNRGPEVGPANQGAWLATGGCQLDLVQPQVDAPSQYLAKVREEYDAEVIALDFLGDEMVARINSWVSAKTRGKIEGILGSLDPLTSLLAINAIYFKDFWDKPFLRELTREESFHTSAGRTLKVPLMSQYGSYPYYKESKFQAVRLPYKTSRLAMYVFLPAKRSSLQEFRQNLNSAAWDKWTRQLKAIGGHIRFPRFKLTYESNLKSALAKLGMEIAFDPERARFDAINFIRRSGSIKSFIVRSSRSMKRALRLPRLLQCIWLPCL